MLAQEMLPTANSATDSVEQDYSIIVPEMLEEFEGIDDSLVKKLKTQFAKVQEESKR